jgi:hypothetical protein
MDNHKVNEVLIGIVAKLEGEGYTPIRHPADKEFPPFPVDPHRTPGIVSVLACNHAMWMAMEAVSWGGERLEKKFRWLGFIQGVLWMAGEQTIMEAKNANKPVETSHDRG